MAPKILAAVIGLGKFGSSFARMLISLEREVIGIDKNSNAVKRIQNEMPHVYQADAMNKDALHQIGLNDCTHALVSVGQSISNSAMIAMYLKEMGIANVWVKAIHDDHSKLLQKIGVDKVIIPDQMAAREFANRMAVPGFIEYLPFEGEIAIKELTIEQWADQSLRQLDLPNRHRVQIIARKRANAKTFRFIPLADEPLAAGDILVAIGTEDALATLAP